MMISFCIQFISFSFNIEASYVCFNVSIVFMYQKHWIEINLTQHFVHEDALQSVKVLESRMINLR
jgi:hypothetical protein